MAALLLGVGLWARAQEPLPGTQPLTGDGDRSAQMVAGIGRFLDGETERSIAAREQFWRVDPSSPEAYEKSVAPNRARLAKMLGVVDPRVANPELEYVASVSTPAKVGESPLFDAYAVRWPVLEGVFGEGLLLQPKGRVMARIVALPDADQTPEMIAGLAEGVPAPSQYARRLAEHGCQVIVPVLIDRASGASGNPRIGRVTRQPHREWIYRQAFEMGRHVIGYEIQKIQSAIDWLERQDQGKPGVIGVAGWGEGGLLAFYAAALDTRIHVAAISGYFGRRESLWEEPIYRNVFGLLREFGDAEIARLIVPRRLIVEQSAAPAIDVPLAVPATAAARNAAVTPGRIPTPTLNEVKAEVERARRLAGPFADAIVHAANLEHGAGRLFEGSALRQLLAFSGFDAHTLNPIAEKPSGLRTNANRIERQHRQVAELQRFTQRVMLLSADGRENSFWIKMPLTTPAAWQQAVRPWREQFAEEIIGRYPVGQFDPNPHTRRISVQPKWTGYEVVLDVLPDVFAWGYLLVPHGIKPGEKRPVVVVQHGLEGVPADTINDDRTSRAYAAYKAFGARLAERGFIVFSPHNPYRGEDKFRLLQRKANPLGKSLFSFIVAQHEVILNWLAAQPNVDPARIGFYGLSYGGKTAMRVPAILDRYALSICSGDFNEWIYKNVSTDFVRSYMFTKEWEMFEFNLGTTFNYAEMAALIAPRPFMVERGHDDGVGIDEWVAYEYAKVNRLYAKLKIPDRTTIEYFNGPHTINGVETYKFLHRHLNWPEP